MAKFLEKDQRVIAVSAIRDVRKNTKGVVVGVRDLGNGPEYLVKFARRSGPVSCDASQLAVDDWRKVVNVDEYGAVTDETGKTLREATVAEYFRTIFGRWLDDPQTKTAKDMKHPNSPYNPEFHISTFCGEHCKIAMDFANRIIQTIDRQPGIAPEKIQRDKDLIIRVAEQTVLEMVYG